MQIDTPAVRFSHISMQFPGVLANDDISFSIRPGEVFALVGENGAGKSTLMNILYGLIEPTAGEVYIRGEKIGKYAPSEAIARGIGMVHQHFMLVPSFTVAENIVLSQEPRKKALLYDFKSAEAQARALVDDYKLYVDPKARVRDLNLGMQQRVEILKTLHRGADILILDEPTAVLTPQETDELFAVIRRVVREKGMTVIIITHKLYEVMAISDRVGVMRGGRLVGVSETCDVNERILASMMVGNEVLLGDLERAPMQGNDAVTVDHLEVLDDRGVATVKGVSFAIKRGEILGIAGVEGNGQSELVEAVCGLRPVRGGSVSILGQDASGLSPGEVRSLGLAHIPEDRLHTGISAAASVTDNLIAGKERRKEFSRFGLHLKRQAANEYAAQLYDRFDIRGAGVDVPAGSLSGGNMQKVVVAREFSFDAPVLVIAQPTRGIDVGAIEFIHSLILEKRNAGCAVLLISADLDEVIRLSDRILTLYEGRITGEFDTGHIDRTEIGLHMTGAHAAQQE